MVIAPSLLLIFTSLSNLQNLVDAQSDDNSLVQLHVLFRHGDRTPDLREVYPNDPYRDYTYPPWGYGQLTEAGRLKEFSIGKSLRKSYEKFLLGLKPTEVQAKTTNYPRTKLSCQLVLTGLLSTQQDDDANNTQNYVCDYQNNENDQLLGDPSKYCPEYKDMYQEQSTKLKGKEIYNNNKQFYDYLIQNSGWTSPTVNTSAFLYYILKSQETLGLELPKWTNSIWPIPFSVRAADEFLIHTVNTKMKRIAAGLFLKNIIDETENLNNMKKEESATKVFLYSSHDFKVAFVLILLEQFAPHIPPYGAYITFEVHIIDGIYGFKILYEDYSTEQTTKIPLNIKGCGKFCPIDNFKELFSEYFPIPSECLKL